jgi:hypothetical protein
MQWKNFKIKTYSWLDLLDFISPQLLRKLYDFSGSIVRRDRILSVNLQALLESNFVGQIKIDYLALIWYQFTAYKFILMDELIMMIFLRLLSQ